MNRAHNAGFTLTEMMVALGVAAILAGLAAPNVRDFIRNSRLTNAANDLLHSLQVARTEAIKRQVGNVAVCGSADPVTANPTCAYNTFRGWIVFADTNGNWQHDNAEPVIERHGLVDAAVTVNTDANANIISYGPSGFANPTDPVALRVPTTTVVVCDVRGVTAVGAKATGRAVFIAPTGRARVASSYADVHGVALPLLASGACP
jgi:type IV fimbrial biogenesis protein FimT